MFLHPKVSQELRVYARHCWGHLWAPQVSAHTSLLCGPNQPNWECHPDPVLQPSRCLPLPVLANLHFGWRKRHNRNGEADPKPVHYVWETKSYQQVKGKKTTSRKLATFTRWGRRRFIGPRQETRLWGMWSLCRPVGHFSFSWCDSCLKWSNHMTCPNLFVLGPAEVESTPFSEKITTKLEHYIHLLLQPDSLAQTQLVFILNWLPVGTASELSPCKRDTKEVCKKSLKVDLKQPRQTTYIVMDPCWNAQLKTFTAVAAWHRDEWLKLTNTVKWPFLKVLKKQQQNVRRQKKVVFWLLSSFQLDIQSSTFFECLNKRKLQVHVSDVKITW